jgi:hypothetical protein
MSTTTVGFAVSDEDRPLLDRLVERFGNGNRSEYLRQTLKVMESIAIAEELQELQARSSDRLAAEHVTTYEDVLARYPKRR